MRAHTNVRKRVWIDRVNLWHHDVFGVLGNAGHERLKPPLRGLNVRVEKCERLTRCYEGALGTRDHQTAAGDSLEVNLRKTPYKCLELAALCRTRLQPLGIASVINEDDFLLTCEQPRTRGGRLYRTSTHNTSQRRNTTLQQCAATQRCLRRCCCVQRPCHITPTPPP